MSDSEQPMDEDKTIITPTGILDTRYTARLTPASVGLMDDPDGRVVRSDTIVDLRSCR